MRTGPLRCIRLVKSAIDDLQQPCSTPSKSSTTGARPRTVIDQLPFLQLPFQSTHAGTEHKLLSWWCLVLQFCWERVQTHDCQVKVDSCGMQGDPKIPVLQHHYESLFFFLPIAHPILFPPYGVVQHGKRRLTAYFMEEGMSMRVQS